jgi:hypothetical protein
MLREFAYELAWFTETAPYHETPPFVMLEGASSTVRVLPGIGMLASGDGIAGLGFEPGSGGVVEFEVFMDPDLYATAEVLAHRVEPDRLVEDTLIKNVNLLLDTDEAYLSLSSRYLDLVLGLTEARWGPGCSGTLLLSDAAPSYGVLRVETTLAGRLELNAISAALSQPDNRYLAAHRATLYITPSLSLGVAEAVRYDSASPGLLYVVNLIPYTLVHKIQTTDGDGEPGVPIRNNVMWACDVSWRIAPGWRLHAEYLLDDWATETASMPNRMAAQLGIQHVRTLGRWPVSAVLEFTKVLRYTYATFYDRDFVHAREPLGYEAGPDAERLYARLRLDTSVDWSWSLHLDAQRRGQGFLGEFWSPDSPQAPWSTFDLEGPVERRVMTSLGIEWIPSDTIRAGSAIGYEWRMNRENLEGNDSDAPVIRLFFQWRFPPL